MDKCRLKLFVNDHTPRTQMAIDSLKQILETELAGRYELEIIDVHENPQEAETHKILATPTVIREVPSPVRRVIGDLSDRHQVLLGLDLTPLNQVHAGTSDNG